MEFGLCAFGMTVVAGGKGRSEFALLEEEEEEEGVEGRSLLVLCWSTLSGCAEVLPAGDSGS